MKFKTLTEIEDYFSENIPEDSPIVSVNAAVDHTGKEGYVFGFDVEDGCDVILGEFVKRWNSYYI